jgi:hypothetical protein
MLLLLVISLAGRPETDEENEDDDRELVEAEVEKDEFESDSKDSSDVLDSDCDFGGDV